MWPRNVGTRGSTRDYKHSTRRTLVVGSWSSACPVTNSETKSPVQRAKSRYGVDFPLLAKQDVNGESRSEFLKRLVGQASDQSNIGWNFEKFLVGRDGRVLERFSSGVSPESRTLVAAIESALSKSTP